MKSAAWWLPRAAIAERIGPDPDGVVEPALVLGQGGPSHRSAPRRQRVVAAVGVLLQARDGVVECRALPDLEVVVDTPAERPGEVVLEVRIAAEAFDAVGDLQAASGVQRTCRHRVHRMQGLDKGVDVPGTSAARRLSSASVASVGTRARSDDSMRTWLCRRERSTASSPTLRRASRHRSSRTAQVSLIRDPAHDQGRIREEATVIGGPGLTRDLTADRHRLREQPGAEEASRPPDRQLAGTAVVAAEPRPRPHASSAWPPPPSRRPARRRWRHRRARASACSRPRTATAPARCSAMPARSPGRTRSSVVGRMGVRRRLAMRAKVGCRPARAARE